MLETHHVDYSVAWVVRGLESNVDYDVVLGFRLHCELPPHGGREFFRHMIVVTSQATDADSFRCPVQRGECLST